jgi:AsmA protein
VLRRFIFAFAALVVLLVMAALAAPMFIPTETVRGELIARIEQATGRQARIDGPIAISVLPTVHVSAGGIGLAGLTGTGEALKVDSVSFGVALLPLISGRVAIKSITIVKPQLVYEIDAAGHSNWQAAEPPAEPAAGGQPKSMEDLIASAETPQQAVTQETLATLDRIGVDRLTVQDGTLTYRDQRSGNQQTVSAMNLTLSAPDLARGAKLDGSFVWDGKTETISLTLGSRPDPTKLAALPVDFSLSDDLATITAKGTALDGDTMFTGTVTANGGSLANLAGRFGAVLPTAPAYGAFDLSATLAATGERTTLDHFAVDLGGAKFDGQAVIATNRPRPGIGVRLTAGSIDADAFVAPAAAAAGGGTGGTPAAATPIDLSALGAVDANVAFTAQAVQVGSVALRDLGLDAKLVDGTLQATISKVTVNDAPGSGNLTISTKSGTPAISGAVKMNGLDLAGVLALAGVSAPVTGSGSVDVAFKTSGATSSALANNLDASGSLSLANGKVTGLHLADSIGGDKAANEIDDIAVTAAFKSLTSPISAKGALTWRKVRFDVSANADVRALLAGKTTAVVLQAQSKTVSLGFNGDAGMSGLGKGEVVLATPSLRNLLAWIGQPIGAGGGLQAFSIKGAVVLTKDQFSFDRASFTLDKSSGLGTGTVAFGKRLSVSAGLSMKLLDVTPYMSASGATGSAGTGGSASGGGGGWSTAPIAFDGLKAVDANLNLKADQIIAGKVKIGATAMTVTLAGGKLAAKLTDMSLYEGKGSGTFSIDGAASTPAVAAAFQLSGLSALPFLTDAIGFDRIEGTGAFSFDLSASGDSQAALMRGLKGKGATEFRDGAIRGFNLASLKSLSLQSVLGGQLGTGDRTDFSELTGSYTIAGGVLTNNDLVLVGPLIRASGAGTVDIGSRTISYRLEPKIVGTLQGQGASGDATGLSLPFRIEGSWDNPRTIPEFGDILANPNQTVDQLKKVGGGLLNSIFGGGNKAGNGGGQAPAAQQPTAAQPAEPAAQQQPGAAPTTAAEPQPITPQANQPQDGTAPADQPGASPAEQKPAGGTDQQQPASPLQLLVPQLLPNSQ